MKKFIAFIVLIFIVTYPVMYKTSQETVEITVKNKSHVVTGSGDSVRGKYLIYTEQGVYENTDSTLFWKFDSSDVYNDIEVGQTYTAKVAGWRWEFGSWYKNIIEVKLKS